MVDEKIVAYRYVKISSSTGVVGITVDAINEKGESISNPLLQVNDDTIANSTWSEITLDEFRELAREYDLCRLPGIQEHTTLIPKQPT